VPVAQAGAEPAGADAAVDEVAADVAALGAAELGVAAAVETGAVADVDDAGELVALLELLLHAATPRASSAVAATVATAVREVLTR
jgi:hypothetical protein